MQPIQGIQLPTLQPADKKSDVAETEKNFTNMLSGIVSEVKNQQESADSAVQQLHAGGAKNLHEAMIAMEQADISIRFMVQVRNKALEAYQEIMRMQV
ncbi:MAG TPA: flagellar hook-basal body complex protein FliE [Desulfobulbaceae bacterium]|nr:flagellar hook-basal body complex protein FliE [Desulfobulbaceae bacterium]